MIDTNPIKRHYSRTPTVLPKQSDAPTPTDIGLPTKYTQFRDDQFEYIDAILQSKKRFIGLQLPTGCHAPGQKILMFDGTVKAVEDINIGDTVMGWDSTPRRVLNLHHGIDRMCEIVPVKGESFTVNTGHILTVYKINEGGDYPSTRPRIEDIRLIDYMYGTDNYKNIRKLLRTGVDFKIWHQHKIPPYILGVFLGDGSLAGTPMVTKPDIEIHNAMHDFAASFGDGFTACSRGMDVSITDDTACRWRPNRLVVELESLGLWNHHAGDKFIPFDYKVDSRHNRLEILAGLLDTDGHLTQNCFDYISKSRQLADDVVFLCRSLGLAAYLTPCIKHCQNDFSGEYFRVSISGDVDMIPCRIPRRKAAPRRQSKSVLVTGFDIKEKPHGEYFGFEIEGDGRYVLGDFTVTHNSGKSLIYTGAALLGHGRSAMLTVTKTLNDQLFKDMSSIGLVDIRGLNNYLCLALAEGGEYSDVSDESRPWTMSCEDAPCMFGAKCNLKYDGCLYFDKVRAAKQSRFVTSNYSYFMHQIQNQNPLGKFEYLFLDEAHDAVDQLTKFMTVELNIAEVEGVIGDKWITTLDLGTWRSWASRAMIKLESRYQSRLNDLQIRRDRKLMRELRMMRRLLQKLSRVAGAVDWIVYNTSKANTVAFSPLWPNRQSESLLFDHVPHIVAVSATLTRKTMQLMGIGGVEDDESNDYDYFEAGSKFPVENNPLYWVRTIKVHKGNTESEKQFWVGQIDNIIDGRPDRKGIVHTTSYEYARYIAGNSRNGRRLIVHNRLNTKQRVEEFKRSHEPVVLVSPAVGTGHDFPDDMCRFQIHSKIPFPDTMDPLTAARCADDKDYGRHIAATKLVQQTGRGNRSEHDWCENFILDDQAAWFLGRYAWMFPYWWMEGYEKLAIVPPAMSRR